MALENLTKITSVGISSHIALTGVTTVGFITSADAWVGGALTVGGNITIGGTVTYEDVTNIDSVGIITSQNGLRVTAGGINVTAGVSTYSGLVDVNNRIDVVGGANIDQANITGILTATTLIGALTTTDACQTGDLTIVNGNPDLRLKDSNHTGNNTEHIIAFQDSSGNNQMNIGSPFGEQHLRIKHGTTDLVKIQTNGRVGINTTSVDHVLQTQGSGNSGSVRIENSHTTLTVSGNTASTAFPHNLVLSNYQGSGNADNRMASIGFDIPTTSSHANATIAYQATNSSGNGDLQFWLEDDNTSKERLRITSDGHIGIGSDAPSIELDILNTSSSADLRLKTTANSFNSFIMDSNRAADTQFAIIDGRWNGNVVNRIQFVTGSDGTNKDDGYMAFHTRTSGSSLAERLRINSDGKINIGTLYNASTTYVDIRFDETTTYSATSNHVNGIKIFNDCTTDNGFAGIELAATDADDYYGSVLLKAIADGTNYSNDFVIQTRHGGNYGERFRIESDGKVGIGTNAPDTALHITGSGAATEKLITFNTEKKRNNYIGINGSDNLVIAADDDQEGNDSSIRLKVDDTEVIRLRNGLAGVRQDDPKATLHVKAHDNNWEAGLLLEDNTGNDGWNLHPESSDASFLIGYNDDTTQSLTSQTATTVVKLHSGGNLEISNGDLKVASGHGVDFTAAASGNATSGQTILDDYEQGTYTPLMYGHSTGTGSDTISGNGYYTKVGNVVTTVLVFSNKNGTTLPSGGSEQFRIAGLPFNAHQSGGNQNTANIFTYNVNFDPSESQVFICASNNNYLRGYRNRDTATWQAWLCSDWRQSQIYLYLSLTYLSAV